MSRPFISSESDSPERYPSSEETPWPSNYVFVFIPKSLGPAIKYCEEHGMKLADIKNRETMLSLYTPLRKFIKKKFKDYYFTRMHTGFYKFHTVYGEWSDYTRYNATIHRDLFYKDPLRSMAREGMHIDDVIWTGAGCFDILDPRESIKFRIVQDWFPMYFFCLNGTSDTTAESVETITSGLQLSQSNSYMNGSNSSASFFSASIIFLMAIYLICTVWKILTSKKIFKANRFSENRNAQEDDRKVKI